MTQQVNAVKNQISLKRRGFKLPQEQSNEEWLQDYDSAG